MKDKKNHIWFAMILIAGFLLLTIFGAGSDIKGIRDMRFGIDIRGGVEAVFEPVGVTGIPSEKQMEAARNVMESRLDAQNITDREVTVDKNEGHIIVRFPWKSDEKEFNPEQAISELGETAKLTFRDPQGNVLVEGQNVADSSVTRNSQTGEYEVELQFDSEGEKAFALATQKLVGEQMGIYMDEQMISNPKVKQAISGGQAVINGMANYEEAKALSDKINSGALPFSMETSNYNTISPTLGSQALKAMITASIVAVLLVIIFMISIYRLPGVISCLTLVFQMCLQILALSIPQYTLTLPGIAGLILSVGMAVDANIIISERIGEELKTGSGIRSAVKKGYHNAFSSVLDGNLTTAAVAVILMIFGSGTMLSFGYTLFTGVIINLLAGVWMSRFMLESVIRYDKCNKEKFFRKKKERKRIRFAEKRKWVFLFTACVLLIGGIVTAVNGVKLDTQFTGGVVLKYTYSGEADTEKIKEAANKVLGRPASVQTSQDSATGDKKLVLTLAGNEGISPDDQKAVSEEINRISDTRYELSETFAVEPYIGAKALKNSALAIALSALFIIVYIWVRFQSLSGLSAGVSAVAALIHDVILVFFVFGVFRIPVNDAFVAVTLTIIGYSINDTIVLYDRIRENIKKRSSGKKETLCALVDRSITETIGRSVKTAVTTAICVAVVLVFSLVYHIESIRVFSLPLLVGIISGCYSSVCVAGPLWVTWKEFRSRRESTEK
ncbi:protein translocase subunit SecD [Diplocloster agilis]|uniref:Multifunctional fusion protein n=1 Tax=Diplocloster agilis TaxID=2850323 RepID=A0A949NG70_9FIRM|nr:protein translocase subunit SecD [Diplocloster agilis]MBU9738499.1 protein translocase subunit SecD [Diplocloster agilis]